MANEHCGSHIFTGIKSDLRGISSVVQKNTSPNRTVRLIRGEKMKTKEGFFDEVSAAFQFPVSFGYNWAGFTEYMGDLDWLEIKGELAIIVSDADLVLAYEPDAELSSCICALYDAAAELSEPVTLGEDWDRPEVTLLAFLQFSTDDGLRRWIACGANFPFGDE
jgi:hypothetical protein